MRVNLLECESLATFQCCSDLWSMGAGSELQRVSEITVRFYKILGLGNMASSATWQVGLPSEMDVGT